MKPGSDLVHHPEGSVHAAFKRKVAFPLNTLDVPRGNSPHWIGLNKKMCKTLSKDSSCQYSSEQMVNINNLWSSFSLTYALHLYLHRSNAGPS